MPTPADTDTLITINTSQISTTIEQIFIEEQHLNKSSHYPTGETLNELKSALIAVVNHLNQVVSGEGDIDLSQLIDESLLSKLPVFQPNLDDLHKKEVNSYPFLLQLIVLIHYLREDTKRKRLKKQWVLLVLLIAIRLKIVSLKTYYQTVIRRIKLPIFSKSQNYLWIWRVLDSQALGLLQGEKYRCIGHRRWYFYHHHTPPINLTDLTFFYLKSHEKEPIVQIFARILHNLADIYFSRMQANGDAKTGLKRAKQLHYIAKALEISFYKNKKTRNKIEAEEKQREQKQQAILDELAEQKRINKIPSQSAQVLDKPVYLPPTSQPYHWEKADNSNDIEYNTPTVQAQYLLPKVQSLGKKVNKGDINASFEEAIENVEKTLGYSERPSPSIAYIPMLQTLELSLQQIYLSRRDFRFNTDTRLLSQFAYQRLFSQLAYDSLRAIDKDFSLANQKSAKLLLLSFLTALPVKTLLQPNFIASSNLFVFQATQVSLQYQLGITPRRIVQNHLTFENNSDKVTLPLPVQLVRDLSHSKNLPKIANHMNDTNELAAYLANLRTKLELPYLSIHRIETALEAVLTRYVKGSHTHIAELICRTPAPDAPAVFYSSHSNKALIIHYVQAINWLNVNNHLALDYFSRKGDNNVGSSFALTLESMQGLVTTLQKWVNDSEDVITHFNRISGYVWLVLCLLTGIRPNNALGVIKDIDLDTGWLMINDKPNKVVKNHRLIPLCDTLIEHLRIYQQLLAKLRTHTLTKPHIAKKLYDINTDEAEVTLINFLSENFDTLNAIKRGEMNTLLKDFIELDFYWTRHFVRTQLEKREVPIHLINGIIGHEKNQQEILGKFSSTSLKQLHNTRHTFEKIAVDLTLDSSLDFLMTSLAKFNNR